MTELSPTARLHCRRDALLPRLRQVPGVRVALAAGQARAPAEPVGYRLCLPVPPPSWRRTVPLPPPAVVAEDYPLCLVTISYCDLTNGQEIDSSAVLVDKVIERPTVLRQDPARTSVDFLLSLLPLTRVPVRGLTSTIGNNQPLHSVDGVPCRLMSALPPFRLARWLGGGDDAQHRLQLP